MKEVIRLLVFNACVAIGVNFVFQSEQLLGPVGDQIRKLPQWLSKPTIDCPPCQSSVWGTLVFWMLGADELNISFRRRLLLFPLYVLSLCGFLRAFNLVVLSLKKEASQ